MSRRIQSDQMVQEANLPILAKPSGSKFDVITISIDNELRAPLRIEQTNPVSASIRITANKTISADGAAKTTPPINESYKSVPDVLIDFVTGAVTPAGAALVEGQTFALPQSFDNYFRRCAFVLGADGKINTKFSSNESAYGTLPDPGLLFASIDGLPLGWVDLVGGATINPGAYKSASSAGSSGPIQITNAVAGEPSIFRFAAGAGGGGAGGGSTDFKVQTITNNVAVIKKGYILLDTGEQLVTSAVNDFEDLSVNLKTQVSTAGVTAPMAGTNYYLYVDMYKVTATASAALSGRVLYPVKSGTTGGFVVLSTPPETTNARRYVPVATLRTDGSSNYTVFYDYTRRLHDTVGGFVHDTQYKTFQVTTVSASLVIPHLMIGEPQTVQAYYYDGATKKALDASQHVLNKTATNLEISSLGYALTGGKYIELVATYLPNRAGNVITLQNQYVSPWMTSNAVTTLAHGADLDAIRGYEVQEWNTGTGRVRNIPKDALVTDFDNTNFYLQWTGLSPTASLRYRVVSGGTPIPASIPIPFTGYTKIVGTGLGAYPTLTAALTDAVPGDNILVTIDQTVTTNYSTAVNDLTITYINGAKIFLPGGQMAFLLSGQDITIKNAHVFIDSSGGTAGVFSLGGSAHRCKILDFTIQCQLYISGSWIGVYSTANNCFASGTIHGPGSITSGWRTHQMLTNSLALIATNHRTPVGQGFTSLVNTNITLTGNNNGEIVIVDTNAPRTIGLPSAATYGGFTFTIKDVVGLANLNPITLARVGSEKIDGINANIQLSAPYGFYRFVSDGTDWWRV